MKSLHSRCHKLHAVAPSKRHLGEAHFTRGKEGNKAHDNVHKSVSDPGNVHDLTMCKRYLEKTRFSHLATRKAIAKLSYHYMNVSHQRL